MLQAIVFDFDGVLVDSEPIHYRAFLRALERFDYRFGYEEYVERYVGFDDRDAFRAFLRQLGRTPGEADELLPDLIREKGAAFEAIVSEGVVTFEGTEQFVQLAAEGLPVAIASGATSRDIRAILTKLGWGSVFDPIVTADLVKHSKPDPETYCLAVEGLSRRLGGDPLRSDRCLAIEDTPAGIESARRAGLRTLGLATTTNGEALDDAERVVSSLGGVTLEQLGDWYA